MKICSAPGCTRPASGNHKYCGAHQSRLQRNGNFDPPIRPTAEERFWSKVEKTDTCWIWKAAKGPLGYGRFGLGDKVVMAYRYAYELLVGPIPAGLTIDHLCRNPSCVNPEHLEPVTQGENVKRGTFTKAGADYNRNKTHCPKGHPLSGDNLYFYRGRRHCKECHRAFTREWRQKNKQLRSSQAKDITP